MHMYINIHTYISVCMYGHCFTPGKRITLFLLTLHFFCDLSDFDPDPENECA